MALVDSAQLLTTIAQLSGGFVAIISGFIVSKLLSTEAERESIRMKSRRADRVMRKEFKARGITNADLVSGKRADEVQSIIEELRPEELFIQDSIASDPKSTKWAFFSILPMVLFGIIVPLLLIAFGMVNLDQWAQLLVLSGFIAGLTSIFLFIGWYAWNTHAQ